MDDQPADLFDRRRRIVRRQARRGDDFIGQQICDALQERLTLVTRRFERVLILGARHSALIDAIRRTGASLDVTTEDGGPGLGADADRLSVEPGSYDLVLWPGGLESINDVPGALLRARFALKPDGLLLGALVGDGSFPVLRAALRDGAMASGGAMAARLHPQISLQAMGVLLQQSGLALPVVDVDALALRYRDIGRLVADLRAAALTSLLAGAVPPLQRLTWAATAHAFASAGTDGATVEQLRIVHFSGWAPDPSQPQAARRGSATMSLAKALAGGAGPVGG